MTQGRNQADEGVTKAGGPRAKRFHEEDEIPADDVVLSGFVSQTETRGLFQNLSPMEVEKRRVASAARMKQWFQERGLPVPEAVHETG